MTPQEILDKTATIKANGTNPSYSVEALKGTGKGMLVGAGAGLAFAFYKGYSKLWCAFIGSMAGAIVFRAMAEVKNPVKTKTPNAVTTTTTTTKTTTTTTKKA